ncbi:hypothetical protein FisN_16Lh088 [Fistulifera solaris]|uniref:NADP-dependent oxidoreductase domain-containing protein n=1 Tax=Fistulifera solaris TaxID=1519565 RepID=A0A1Z5KJZ3_FISSO|nr:hypothetical protein FisN_16Lh088 [Fistulifera solaris]|eukprot:GAX26258.1 hypothetical protein FisN_16Lh088 [Fistulifera solaris]
MVLLLCLCVLPTAVAILQPSIGTVSAGPLQISSIGCGTWSWGNRFLWGYNPDQDEELYQSYKIVRDAGVSLFDTADSYGTLDLNGRSEILLGEFERRYLNQRGWLAPPLRPQQVATKLAPYPWRITSQSFVNAAEASLGRLQQDRLAICQLHWSTANYQPLQERALWDGLRRIYEKDLCQAVGVSNYGPRQLQKIVNALEGVPLATAQIQYSLLTYQTARYMNEICDELGIRVIAYSPLCLGLLTCRYNLDNLPPFPRQQLFRELLPSAQGLLGTLKAVADEYNKTPAQIAINWALCKGTVPIPGCRTVSQARSTIETTQFRLKQDAMEELDRMALSVKKPMVQNVFQTN